jgi:hypothetical protein
VGEDLTAQVVHYVLSHRLHHHRLGILNSECRKACEQEHYGDEDHALIGALAETETLAGVLEKQSKSRRICFIRGKEEIDRSLGQRRAGEDQGRAENREHEGRNGLPLIRP